MSDATVAASSRYQPPAPPTPSAPAAGSASSSSSSGPTLWSHGSFSFKDLLDIVNPLQHIPIIGSVYRYLTGDEPSGGARIVGDSIYGGPIGFGISVVSTAFLTDAKGEDLGERLLADVFGPRSDGPTVGTPVVASASPATTPASNAAGTTQATAARATPAAAPQAALATAAAPRMALAAVPPQPVAMNQLYRSPPANPPATPEQAFLAQTAQFQHQIDQGRGANGAVLNHHPVPLELSSNLLPTLPPNARVIMPAAPAPAPAAKPAAAPSQAPAAPAASAAAAPNPIAQKMIDALNKYEQLKRQEEQQDSVEQNTPAKVDLSL
jgi:hypothetical protein